LKKFSLFYKQLGPKDLQIPERKMKIGLPCAIFLYNQWNRGEIIGSPVDGHSRIFFMDYGTNCLVESKEIKYLLKVFANLPRLGLRGCLDGVKPAKYAMNFELESTTNFFHQVTNKAIWAKVVRILPGENIYLLALVDKTGDGEKNINLSMLALKDIESVTSNMLLEGDVVRLRFLKIYSISIFN
jgi:hypothetical protein